MVDAWRTHPDLHAAGALMPLVLHFSGDKLHEFVSTVLPRHLTTAAAYLSLLNPALLTRSGSPATTA